jgi:hypothetical protein
MGPGAEPVQLLDNGPKIRRLLESHDAGEPENKGGLVIADVGKGKYVYCSYSLFRQLPAGVPGAYRLLANMSAREKIKNRLTARRLAGYLRTAAEMPKQKCEPEL